MGTNHIVLSTLTDTEIQVLIDDLRKEQQERMDENTQQLIQEFETAFQKLKDNKIMVWFNFADACCYLDDVGNFEYSDTYTNRPE